MMGLGAIRATDPARPAPPVPTRYKALLSGVVIYLGARVRIWGSAVHPGYRGHSRYGPGVLDGPWMIGDLEPVPTDPDDAYVTLRWARGAQYWSGRSVLTTLKRILAENPGIQVKPLRPNRYQASWKYDWVKGADGKYTTVYYPHLHYAWIGPPPEFPYRPDRRDKPRTGRFMEDG